MLSELKYDLCYAFNELTSNKGVREIARESGLSISTISRIKNYEIDELKAEKIMRSVMQYRPIELNI